MPYSLNNSLPSKSMEVNCVPMPLLSSTSMAAKSSSSPACCEKDCQQIYATWDRLSILGQALACRNLAERRHIKETYRVMFAEDLLERLHSAQLANPKNEMYTILYLWMLEPHERDAVVAHIATERCEADHKALVEIYTRRKSNQLFLTKQVYLARFRRHLDQDVISETAHSYQKILAALATSHRSHHSETSQHIAKCDAKRLYEARKGSSGLIDEATVLEIFSKRSIPQLRLTFSSYKHIYGHNYTKILKEGCGEFVEPLRVVIKCMHEPFQYYAKMLYTCLKGGPKNRSLAYTLSRLIIGSTEVGMQDVEAAFQRSYGMKLQDALCETVSVGDYRDFLLSLTNAPASTHLGTDQKEI